MLKGIGITTILLAAKADPDARDSEGGTPLHAAAHRNDAETVRLLLAAKADPNAKDKEGKTPLDVAKGKDVVKLLKEAGAVQTQ